MSGATRSTGLTRRQPRTTCTGRGTGCRRMWNGSTPAAPALPPLIAGATINRVRADLPGRSKTQADAINRWQASARMLSECSTCTATWRNGSSTIMSIGDNSVPLTRSGEDVEEQSVFLKDSERDVRGGSNVQFIYYLRSANRTPTKAWSAVSAHQGFRIARTLKAPPASPLVRCLFPNGGYHGVPLAAALGRQCRRRLTFEGSHWRARAPASGTQYHQFSNKRTTSGVTISGKCGR